MPLNDLGNTLDPMTKTGEKAKKSPITDEKLFEVATAFYSHMESESEWSKSAEVMVWEGSLSHWFRDNGVSYLYSPVTKLLYAAGCCNIASRGGGTKPSLVHLHHPPTMKEVKTHRESTFFFERETMTRKGREQLIEQMVHDQRAQIADLMERVERLENDRGIRS